jgi:hypothetical protein
VPFEGRSSRRLPDYRNFPIGDHDDGLDALEMAFRLLGELGGGVPAGVSQLPLQRL